MEKKVDLKNLKSEIDSRKRDKKEVAVRLGESGKGSMPSDQFLNGLLTAIKTGVPNKATNALKILENRVDAKEGKPAMRRIDDVDLMQHVDTVRQPISPRQERQPILEAPERDELLYAEFERKQRELYQNYPSTYKTPPVQQSRGVGGQVLNEEVMREIKTDIIGYIKENFAPIIEEAMKDAIMDMYAEERIKQVIKENTEVVEKIVVDTIRKIQDRNKAQQVKK
jgi:hypothetical protein